MAINRSRVIVVGGPAIIAEGRFASFGGETEADMLCEAHQDVTRPKNGRWIRLAKAALEKYFLYEMKRGVSAPFYGRAILRSLGTTKLRRPA